MSDDNVPNNTYDETGSNFVKAPEQTISAGDFAKCADLAIQNREASYDAASMSYDLTKYEALENAMKTLSIHKVWFWPLRLFIFDGYAETEEWTVLNKE